MRNNGKSRPRTINLVGGPMNDVEFTATDDIGPTEAIGLFDPDGMHVYRQRDGSDYGFVRTVAFEEETLRLLLPGAFEEAPDNGN
jgi:hypothetical protein